MKNMLSKINNMAKLKNWYVYAVFFQAASILILSVIPGIGGGINSGFSAHCLAYFFFSFTIALHNKAQNISHPLLCAVLISGSYGIFIEFIQYFIPYREFDINDMAVNICASLAATIPVLFMIRGKII